MTYLKMEISMLSHYVVSWLIWPAKFIGLNRRNVFLAIPWNSSLEAPNATSSEFVTVVSGFNWNQLKFFYFFSPAKSTKFSILWCVLFCQSLIYVSKQINSVIVKSKRIMNSIYLIKSSWDSFEYAFVTIWILDVPSNADELKTWSSLWCFWCGA